MFLTDFRLIANAKIIFHSAARGLISNIDAILLTSHKIGTKLSQLYCNRSKN